MGVAEGAVVAGGEEMLPVLGNPERGNWIVCARSSPTARAAAKGSAQSRARKLSTEKLKPEGANDDKDGFWSG